MGSDNARGERNNTLRDVSFSFIFHLASILFNFFIIVHHSGRLILTNNGSKLLQVLIIHDCD